MGCAQCFYEHREHPARWGSDLILMIRFVFTKHARRMGSDLFFQLTESVSWDMPRHAWGATKRHGINGEPLGVGTV